MRKFQLVLALAFFLLISRVASAQNLIPGSDFSLTRLSNINGGFIPLNWFWNNGTFAGTDFYPNFDNLNTSSFVIGNVLTFNTSDTNNIPDILVSKNTSQVIQNNSKYILSFSWSSIDLTDSADFGSCGVGCVTMDFLDGGYPIGSITFNNTDATATPTTPCWNPQSVVVSNGGINKTVRMIFTVNPSGVCSVNIHPNQFGVIDIEGFGSASSRIVNITNVTLERFNPFPTQIQNGQFNQVFHPTQYVCSYYFVPMTTKQCSNTTSNIPQLPQGWTILNFPYGSPGIDVYTNQNDPSSPSALLFQPTFNWNFPDNFCGLNNDGVCSGISTGGTQIPNVEIAQSITLSNAPAKLHFSMKIPRTQVFNPNKINASSNNEFYTCNPAVDCLSVVGSFFLNIINLDASTIVYSNQFQATNDWQFVTVDIPNGQIGVSYQLRFELFTGSNDKTANEVLLDNVSIEYPSAFVSIPNKFIQDINTMTPILVNNVTDGGGSVATVNVSARISRNFSSFYKFYIQSQTGSSHSANGVGNIIAYDSSGNSYVMDSSSHGVWSGSTTVPYWFGYVPSNVTRLSVEQSLDGGGNSLKYNITFNSILANRRGWNLPIVNANESFFEAWPLLFYNFVVDQTSLNTTYSVYNFRNTTSFNFSIDGSEGTADNNIFIYQGSTLVAGTTDLRSYFQEFTDDYTTVFADNSGIFGETIVVNRTSANNWFNSTKTFPETRFLTALSTSLACVNQCIGTDQQIAILDQETGACTRIITPNGCVVTNPQPNGPENPLGLNAGPYQAFINLVFDKGFLYFIITMLGSAGIVKYFFKEDPQKGHLWFGFMIGFTALAFPFNIYPIFVNIGLALTWAFLFYETGRKVIG